MTLVVGDIVGDLRLLGRMRVGPSGSLGWMVLCLGCGKLQARHHSGLYQAKDRGYRSACRECRAELRAGERIERRRRMREAFRSLWEREGSLYSVRFDEKERAGIVDDLAEMGWERPAEDLPTPAEMTHGWSLTRDCYLSPARKRAPSGERVIAASTSASREFLMAAGRLGRWLRSATAAEEVGLPTGRTRWVATAGEGQALPEGARYHVIAGFSGGDAAE